MTELFWFLGGAITYKLMAHILNVGHSVIFSKQAQLFSIALLCTSLKEASGMRATKYKSFEKLEISKEEINLLIEEDNDSYEQWKILTLRRLQSLIPPRLNKILIWEEVSKMFDESYKIK